VQGADSRVLEVLAVDDIVSESLRVNLGKVDQLGGVVPAPMQPHSALEAFHLDIAGNTPIEETSASTWSQMR